jgi:predicted nucleic acid-binding protein
MSESTPLVAEVEALNTFREFVAEYPILSTITHLYRVRLVLDANVVLADLLWLARRKKPDARTGLQEVLAAGTVVAYAPPQLETEVLRHLPRIAKKSKVSIEVLQTEWLAYRAQIRFRTPAGGELPPHVQDPDDLPYLHLRAEIGAPAIYTEDSDVGAMHAPVVGAEIIVALRDYSRAASVEVSIKMGGAVVAVASGAVLVKLWEWTKAFFSGFGMLPTWIKWLLASAAVAAVIHPAGRTWLRQLTRGLPDGVGGTLKVLGPIVLQAMEAAEQSRKASAVALQRVHGTLAAPTPQPAWAHAMRTCLEEGSPLSVDEICRRVLQDGYVTRSSDFVGYMRKVLRRRGEFAETADGRWTLASTLQPARAAQVM